MIKIENHYLSYEGNGLQLNMELGIIMREMYQKGIVNREMLNEMVWGATLTDEELHIEAEKNREKLRERFNEIMNNKDAMSQILEALLHDKKGDA